ncbi:hypothetical protein R70723_17200 [Paenibacillus sp. FSL R7-0273]|uniref:hypothetical protein n=1 Tax=Paenibacillus sp. FSL R7-0273 TaxID=1536772 RepID=UPI0004F627FA|nr:hypothetical protein [Paenibacillus sp. FSL R7-0273]AIQ47431.1 hypothetical protein R70723_17200 [Paenibacillus sp. FSL R7-0273]OMF96011.1 hypothetical protein BK144_05385 [Paenibacillus sp. FSL R7-0273]
MQTVTNFPVPKLIVKEHLDKEIIRKKVAYGNYTCMDKIVPMIRARGTNLQMDEEGNLRIIGWQRDITRMRKQDVSLSFMIHLTVSPEGIIREALVDDLFNGGKGVLCSKDYLDSRLKEELEGQPFDRKLAARLRFDRFKCFHIFEIMSGIYTSYFMYKEELQQGRAGQLFYEEDIVDIYASEGNLYLAGLQDFKDKEDLSYMVVLYDVFNHITFDEEGYMKLKSPILAEFYLNGELVHSDELYQKEKDYIFIRVQKFMFVCVEKLKAALFPEFADKMMNTNLAPSAFIGIIMQAIGIRSFANNFNYIQYIMTAMQRPRKLPGCIGAILNEEEAARHFEGFDLSYLD